MPKTAKSKSKAKPAAKKKAAPKKQTTAKAKVISHTDDGTPIVNATMVQIRKGVCGKTAQQLVRIPQVDARSKFYVEAAKAIGEREALALPYHGSRMWKCEVKVSDDNGAYGDNRKGGGGGGKKKSSTEDDDDEQPKKKKTNYKTQTPLFRWYKGSLILATLPYILNEIVEVESKMPGKKRWANGLGEDDDLDSSDEEWDDDVYKVEPTIKVDIDECELTEAAYEDSSHPWPHVTRSWISPDLQRFPSRKKAIEHAKVLMKRDALIDRTMFGYGHNGVRLRPVKPTKKVALEAGFVRFLRDGLWIVGQEEAWIEHRRNTLVKKQQKRLMIKSEEEGDGGKTDDTKVDASVTKKEEGAVSEQKVEVSEDTKMPSSDNISSEDTKMPSTSSDDMKMPSTSMSNINSNNDMQKASTETVDAMLGNYAAETNQNEEKKESKETKSTAAAPPQLDTSTVITNQTSAIASTSKTSPVSADGDATKIVSESDASTEGGATAKNSGEPNTVNNESTLTGSQLILQKAKELAAEQQAKPKKVIKRAPTGTRPPPAFVPSTHYKLNQAQITKCFEASIDHYEKVMNTVRVRSLHHELADGFDVFRERGRGRYDMELPLFDTEEFSFLTDLKKASWMPIVNKILGDDALLIHKGCFLSLPGSEMQVYHQDGVHLNKKVHKPCYAINVFIPLVDYDMTNGPTEFCLGTHYLGHENFVKENVYTPIVTAGTPVIFDYRLGHRGLGNNSQSVRPVVYLTYSSSASGKEFKDSVNFSRKYFRKLGELAEMPLSREERSKKRRLDGGNSVASTVVGQDGTTVQRPIAVGDIVNVASRTWPGINKPGGVGLVTNITPVDNSVKYDVTYVLGGRENGIDAQFVQLN